ncbi:TrbC/VirB2 family protein [Desulfovibrio ferrophilus]|uniref:Conjugal transfer protein TrbC n=1 Tax=Desulfovibrio ferrophilus TaxID=241368 RepID=A0A2Z6B3J2_9BACT|nr:TrbC/VirB2 family protein [Desulfovibrio ferrophilus]BBD10104.1 putative uncharacterized protein [Desulfovibrio ferrophilus]
MQKITKYLPSALLIVFVLALAVNGYADENPFAHGTEVTNNFMNWAKNGGFLTAICTAITMCAGLAFIFNKCPMFWLVRIFGGCLIVGGAGAIVGAVLTFSA